MAIPTDTVYGIAVSPFHRRATQRLFRAKQRPRSIQLPVLVDGIAQARAMAELEDRARMLMGRFWPGGLTIVLRRQAGLDVDLGDDTATVGLRSPNHEVARALCTAVGPLATTSANLHGEATPPTAREVGELFGDAVAVVVDGGRCEGAPSTVVDCTGPEPGLIREGCVPWPEVLAHYHPS